jgi:hypothetical protein
MKAFITLIYSSRDREKDLNEYLCEEEERYNEETAYPERKLVKVFAVD